MIIRQKMKRILFVEDDPFIVDIYANQFKKEGYQVDVAGDSKTALEKIRNTYPDLLVLDIKIPKERGGLPLDGEGWELLKIVMSDPKTQNLKVVVASNDSEENNKNNISHFKILKYFLKIQTTPEEIINVVREILK